MPGFLHHIMPLAQGGRLEDWSREFRGNRSHWDSHDVAKGLLLLAGCIVVVWALSYVLTFKERHPSFSSPAGLFLTLCHAHHLPWADRWLLWRVTRAQGLQDPARLFLEPQRLEPNNLGPLFRLKADRLRCLRALLFAHPESPSSPEPVETKQPEKQSAKRPAAPPLRTPLPPKTDSPTLDIRPFADPRAKSPSVDLDFLDLDKGSSDAGKAPP